MTQRISILGSTGSVGQQTVALLHAQGEAFRVIALTGNRNTALLARQARALRPEIVVCGTEAGRAELAGALAGTGTEIRCGAAALAEAAARETELSVAAIVGKAGLAPTLACLGRSRRLALATKECLVAAGELFMTRARESGTAIVPLDSEHHAIGRLLAAHGQAGLQRVVLTASGGPFREYSLQQMATVAADEALRHPTWSMGRRISIDSASMFNKAIEIIEAHHLFGLASAQIDVLIHPQSLVHGLVEYAGGPVYAQLAPARMECVIAEALGWTLPEGDGSAYRVGIEELSRLEFAPPDPERFPALRLAREALSRGGLAGCVLNGALEEAVEAFLEGRIGFLDMADVVEDTMQRMADVGSARGFAEVDAADIRARQLARAAIGRRLKRKA